MTSQCDMRSELVRVDVHNGDHGLSELKASEDFVDAVMVSQPVQVTESVINRVTVPCAAEVQTDVGSNVQGNEQVNEHVDIVTSGQGAVKRQRRQSSDVSDVSDASTRKKLKVRKVGGQNCENCQGCSTSDVMKAIQSLATKLDEQFGGISVRMTELERTLENRLVARVDTVVTERFTHAKLELDKEVIEVKADIRKLENSYADIVKDGKRDNNADI